MCGIVGVWDFRSRNKISEGLIKSMRDTLISRGPDDSGIYIDKRHNLAFGHRRLSIIDLSPGGHQPMSNDDESLQIIYNGEVYNYKEIRKELITKGYKFKSNSDTEVVLKAYEEWGIEAVHKFRGMFAFAIWDIKQEKLFLFRDRAGVKPLYYYFKNGLFIFASELKAFYKHPYFRKELNFDGLALFFQFGYIPTPHTIFKDAYKLKPGHYLQINKNGNLKEIKYWDIIDCYLEEPINKSEEEIEEELENILIKSFKYRMVSDVPLGIFLSGGIDSSAVAALLQSQIANPLKTFTIGFYEKEYNEAPYAKKIARYLGTDHQEFYCTSKEALETIFKLPEIYDEPFGDSSGIPTYLVSKLAREQVKVSLSADGGDELFCGYPYYWKINNLYTKIKNLPSALLYFSSSVLSLSSSSSDKLIKFRKILRQKELKDIFKIIISYWSEDEIKDLLKIPYTPCNTFFNDFEKVKNLGNIPQMQAVDFKTYLCDDILTKVDRATMAVGLEGRDPFLDQDIIEYAAKLPPEFKYQKRESKYILRKILYKYVPKELLERPKQGFSIPIHDWLRKDLSEPLKEYLSYSRIKKQDIFDGEYVKKKLDEHLSGKSNNGHKLWFLLAFQIWYEKWI